MTLPRSSAASSATVASPRTRDSFEVVADIRVLQSSWVQGELHRGRVNAALATCYRAAHPVVKCVAVAAAERDAAVGEVAAGLGKLAFGGGHIAEFERQLRLLKPEPANPLHEPGTRIENLQRPL